MNPYELEELAMQIFEGYGLDVSRGISTIQFEEIVDKCTHDMKTEYGLDVVIYLVGRRLAVNEI